MHNHSTPPKYYAKLFKSLCREELFEELNGDLNEEFYLNVEEIGLSQAKRAYRYEVLRLLRPSVIKRFRKQNKYYNNTIMYKNFLKVAFRNIAKNKLFSFLNITGLAIGMSVGLLIVNLVYDAARFDQFHKNKNRIHRVISKPVQTGFSWNQGAATPVILGERMIEEVPGIEAIVKIRRWFFGSLKVQDNSIFAQGVYADKDFFKVFSFDLRQGNPSSALTNPFSIVLTESLAKKLMPDQNAMGQVLSIPERGEYLVTGIVADPPKRSHFKFDALVSYNSVKPLESQGLLPEASSNWNDFSSGYVYFLLEQGQSLEKVQNWLDRVGQEAYVEDENLYVDFTTQKLTKIVPGKNLNNQLGAEFPPLPLIILGGVAMLIILSACFNYTNLSVARALRRSKEIGVRKIVGSSRRQIFHQFTIETIIITVISVFFSVLIFMVIKPLFISSIPRIDQVMQLETPPVLMLYFLLFAVFIGLIAGIFPSLFFSRIKPLLALRSKASLKLFSHVNIRKGLIIVQFSISIFFLITMNVVLKQYRYTMAFDMGFRQENVLNLSLLGNDPGKVISELEKIPDISAISASSIVVGSGANQTLMLRNPVSNDSLFTNFISATPSYFELHQIDVIAGDIYDARQPGDQLNKMMVNAEFTRFHGFAQIEDVLGKVFYVQGRPMTITGVIEDFNYQYIEEPIRPLIILESTNRLDFVNLLVQGDNILSTLTKIEKAWASIDEESEASLQFLDDQLEEASGFLLIFTRVFGFLGLIAASIACLGLLGMAVFNAESRVKEIGIRKAVGATVSNLIMILSKSFISLILIAGVTGALIAYLVLDKLILAQIHYRVGVGFLDMFIAMAILFSLAFLAVVSQTWKAAKTNPVESLRYE